MVPQQLRSDVNKYHELEPNWKKNRSTWPVKAGRCCSAGSFKKIKSRIKSRMSWICRAAVCKQNIYSVSQPRPPAALPAWGGGDRHGTAGFTWVLLTAEVLSSKRCSQGIKPAPSGLRTPEINPLNLQGELKHSVQGLPHHLNM